jgi:sulfite exporter TauE/SafE
MCGGFAVLCGRRIPDTAIWHVGRMTLAGAFGSMIPGPSWVAALISIGLLVWFAAALAGFVPEPKVVIPGLRTLGSVMAGGPGLATRYAFGVVNGLLPCGLVYAALSLPVATTHPGWGALAMVAFGFGTVPVLSAIALGVQRIVARDLRVRRVVAAGVLIAGLWSVGLRQGVLGSHSTHGARQHQMTEPAHQPDSGPTGHSARQR